MASRDITTLDFFENHRPRKFSPNTLSEVREGLTPDGL